MSTMSIGGLASGLDTAGLISQLMQLEARPQAMLQSRVASEQRVINALQTLNAKLASITSKTSALTEPTSWTAVKATSSNDAVSVTVTGDATPTSLSFTVDNVASSAQATYATTGNANVMAANVDYYISHDDPNTAGFTINTGDGSIQSIAAQINQEGTGLRATLVRVGSMPDGTAEYQLHVHSIATGEQSGFSITEVDPNNPPNPPASPVPFMGGATVTAGENTLITLSGQTTQLVYTSRTITGLMPGIDVTFDPNATGDVTLDVTTDTEKLSESAKALVDTINSVLTEIDSLTAYSVATKAGSILTGDGLMRRLRDELLSTVTHGLNGVSLSSVGIETDRSGKLVFDEATFQAAYEADPTRVTEFFAGTTATDGFADKVAAVVSRYSDPYDGSLSQSIKNRSSKVGNMEDQIAEWDVRLDVRRAALERQYAQLEVALSQLQSQGNWLSGQIAGLPKYS